MSMKNINLACPMLTVWCVLVACVCMQYAQENVLAWYTIKYFEELAG